MEVREFLTEKDEQRIIAAIKTAESRTSGEIRVHFEKSLKEDAIHRATEVFNFLGMDQTARKNGILFYLAVDDHVFAVIGDSGIDQVVPDDFWESIRDEVIVEFKKGDYAKGLEMGILHAGEKLKEFFPVDADDKNELPDEISTHS